MTETALPPPPEDIRPVVAKAPNNRAVWVFGGALAVAAIGLFGALEARRAEISSPAISVPVGPAAGVIAPPPELAIPPDYAATGGQLYPYGPAYAPPSASGAQFGQVDQRQQLPAVRLSSSKSTQPATSASSPPVVASPQASYDQPPMLSRPNQPEFGPTFSGGGPRPEASQGRADETQTGDDRVRAARFAHPGTTVPQGTVMHAVLETALDSTRAGFARAVVSRNVSSFDGTRVLIPKGSKLFGEYQADVSRGQNRALIRWRRLMRPDGTIIDVDSPSADPLGRAGVKGKVNTHFLERFGGAILQSALDLGVQLGARKASDDTYILALPYGTREINPVKPEEIKPTLTVRQGTSVSVFIARDLDFSDVE